jgi:glucose/arabinose dehydrogenase
MQGHAPPVRNARVRALQYSAGVLVIIVIAILSVSGARPAQEPDPGPGPGDIIVTGRERLTWDQVAPSEAELRTYRYVAHVDGVPVDLLIVSCSSPPQPAVASFICSAPLPPLTAGSHDIAVSAYVDPVDRLATHQSWPIRVYLRREGASPLSARRSVLATRDGIQLQAAIVATGLDEPTDLVTLPDGRVLVAERRGRVRVIRQGSLLPSPALVLADVSTSGEGGLISLVADRDFDATRIVFALYTTASGLRLVRFVESNDSLSSGATLLEGLPVSASAPAAILRMGRDRKLYLGLADSDDPRARDDMGSWNGKVIRVNVDGTTPTDDGPSAPIFAIGPSRPAAMEWSESGETLWLAERRSHVLDRVRRRPRASVVSRAAHRQRISLPSGLDATALVLYQSEAVPNFLGDLFVADAASASILRVQLDRDEVSRQTEWLFHGQLDSIRAMSAAADGSLYVATAQALIRISSVLR